MFEDQTLIWTWMFTSKWIQPRPILLFFWASLIIIFEDKTHRIPSIVTQTLMLHNRKPQMIKFWKNWAGTQYGLLAQAQRRNHKSCEPSGCCLAWRCIQATLPNISCPTSLRESDLLRIGWCEGSMNVKMPLSRGKDRRHQPRDTRASLIVPHKQQRPSLLVPSHECRGHFPGHCGSSVSPISQVNQRLR